MKKVIAIILVLIMVFAAMAATTRQEDNIAEAEEEKLEPYYNVATFDDYYNTGISNELYLLSIEDELEPITDTACSYEKSICVANVQFAYANGKSEAWDIYFYNNDGILGTQIVNQQGECINFYGDALTEINRNYNVGIGRKKAYVYPAGDDLSSFTVVLEHG